MYLGLNIAIQMSNIFKIEIETDSSQTVSLLLRHCSSHHPLEPIVANCRYMLSKFIDFKIRKIDRLLNMCADALAKEGRKIKLPLTI